MVVCMTLSFRSGDWTSCGDEQCVCFGLYVCYRTYCSLADEVTDNFGRGVRFGTSGRRVFREKRGEGRVPGLKEDRRIQRTRELLRSAMVSLIREQGFEALTVQHIIDRANVGRSTFYAHFS